MTITTTHGATAERTASTRTGARTRAAGLIAGLAATALLLGSAAVPAQAAEFAEAPVSPTVTIVSAPTVTLPVDKVTVAVKITGLSGPAEWSSDLSVWYGSDFGGGLVSGSKYGEPRVSNGTQRILIAGSLATELPGRSALTVNVTDPATGKVTKAKASVVIRDKGKISLKKVRLSGERAILTGTQSEGLWNKRLKVYAKPHGTNTYQLVGRTTPNGDGTWKFSSTKILGAKVVIRFKSKYVVSTRSNVKTVPVQAIPAMPSAR